MASRPDSDVDRLSLEILPSLRHRVIIHLDDIPFPLPGGAARSLDIQEPIGGHGSRPPHSAITG